MERFRLASLAITNDEGKFLLARYPYPAGDGCPTYELPTVPVQYRAPRFVLRQYMKDEYGLAVKVTHDRGKLYVRDEGYISENRLFLGEMITDAKRLDEDQLQFINIRHNRMALGRAIDFGPFLTELVYKLEHEQLAI